MRELIVLKRVRSSETVVFQAPGTPSSGIRFWHEVLCEIKQEPSGDNTFNVTVSTVGIEDTVKMRLLVVLHFGDDRDPCTSQMVAVSSGKTHKIRVHLPFCATHGILYFFNGDIKWVHNAMHMPMQNASLHILFFCCC